MESFAVNEGKTTRSHHHPIFWSETDTPNCSKEQPREQQVSSPASITHRSVRRPTSTSLFSGLCAGVAQAGVFNPYDRALYLSVAQDRPFLHRANWVNPYSGFLQSIGSRALSGGLYFPLESFFLREFSALSGWQQQFLAGTAAGAVNACLLNPLTTIRYKTWSKNNAPSSSHQGMFQIATSMMDKAQGSVRPFFNGLLPTVYRDVVFGCCYTWLRWQLPKWYISVTDDNRSSQYQWLCNILAAALATVSSGPFNYVRNVHYSTSSRVSADTTSMILADLCKEIHSQPSLQQKGRLIAQRLRLGWGTARVGLGMGFAQVVYDTLDQALAQQQRG